MVYELMFLALKTGEFSQDIVFPAIAGTVVVLMILQQVLARMGYALW